MRLKVVKVRIETFELPRFEIELEGKEMPTPRELDLLWDSCMGSRVLKVEIS